ncbi:hypothetical protein HQQ94_17350 [Shewanella sp. VB17]|uniref:hypothetical protein n=1 Tax=Shewanella sp. VB17 TaxID=2739432 RepID=UPI001563470B|nr:hypothetical protein [Shewanella sp. VB17]NRD74949.1 hypothetical protein [Shewanella sp. VB17]
MKTMKKKWLVSTSMAIALTACGGGSDSATAPVTPAPVTPAPVTPAPVTPAPVTPAPVTPAPVVEATMKLSGKVIDGYVSGATVWLDINGNRILEADEPRTLSGTAGNYAFEFTQTQADCVPYAAMYVDVPIGAIDEDSGEVIEAYQMAFPPSITPLTDGDIRHITPLTSIIWQQLGNTSESANRPHLTCEDLKQNVQLQTTLQNDINSLIENLTDHYKNISKEQIFADFIADDNTEAYEFAQSIVIGLKASYAHKIKLQVQFADAIEVRVVTYQDKGKDRDLNFDNAWYRNTVIFTPTGYTAKEVKLKDNILDVDIVLTDLVRLDKPWGDQALKGELGIREDAYYNIDGTYRCSAIEIVSFTQDKLEYELSNSPAYTYSDTIADCKYSLETPLDRTYRISFAEADKNYFAEFNFRETQAEFKSLPNWVNVENKADMLNAAELITHLNLLPRNWDDEVLTDINYWRKRMWFDNITIDKEHAGDKNNAIQWEKRTLQDNGTTVKECSTDGITWANCITAP